MWYSPRVLPHFDGANINQAITFRLADSLPLAVAMAREGEGDVAHQRRIAAALDAGYGECLLRHPEIADVVERALLHAAGTRYELFAWVIMPNHVHGLIRQPEESRLSDVVHGWKSWTAKEINRVRGASGPVWQREYFDRYMRNERHFFATVAYIEANPVAAGLAKAPEEWRFGSAWWHANRLSTPSSP